MKFTNPVINGFNPDPSVCQVGDKYYAVCSTFEFYPGLPIYESENLIDWHCINHGIKEGSPFDFKDTPNSLGIFAPTIRYDAQKKKFYIITTDICGHGNIILSSTDIYGEFDIQCKFNHDGIDPSLLFDDGTWYLTAQKVVNGVDSIILTIIDVETGEMSNEFTVISTGVCARSVEGPHIYKIGSYFYLIASEGGTEYGHMITQMRSRKIEGPYEVPQNPILISHSNINDTIQATGHGDIIKYNATYYLLHLGIRKVDNNFLHHLGRETFLTPMVFEDGWFKILNKKTSLSFDTDIENFSSRSINSFDDFEFVSKEWLSARRSYSEFCTFQDNTLLITASENLMNDLCPPAILQRQKEFNIECTTDVRITEVSCFSGLTIYYNNEYHCEYGIQNEELKIRITVHGYTSEQVLLKNVDRTTKLKIEADQHYYYFIFEDQCLFKYSSAGFSTEQTRTMTFTGVMIGLFCENGIGHFKYFELNQKK